MDTIFLSWFRPELFHWRINIMDRALHKSILDGSNRLKLKTLMDLFLISTQRLASQDINWWTGVHYCDVFISCLDSHSDGTHSLQRIHCWASDAMLHFSKPDEETNSSTSWMVWGWGHFNFWVNYSFKNYEEWYVFKILTKLTANVVCVHDFKSQHKIKTDTFYFCNECCVNNKSVHVIRKKKIYS